VDQQKMSTAMSGPGSPQAAGKALTNHSGFVKAYRKLPLSIKKTVVIIAVTLEAVFFLMKYTIFPESSD